MQSTWNRLQNQKCICYRKYFGRSIRCDKKRKEHFSQRIKVLVCYSLCRAFLYFSLHYHPNDWYSFVDIFMKLQLLIDYGLMKPLDKGTYFYLPILQRSIDKANAIIERFMTKIDAHKISIPNLTPVSLWKDSGLNSYRISICSYHLKKIVELYQENPL